MAEETKKDINTLNNTEDTSNKAGKTQLNQTFIDATDYFSSEPVPIENEFRYKPSTTGIGADFDPNHKPNLGQVTEVKNEAKIEEIYGTTEPENPNWGSSATLVWEITDHIDVLQEEEETEVKTEITQPKPNKDFQTTAEIDFRNLEKEQVKEKIVPEADLSRLDTKSPFLDETQNLGVVEGGKIRLPNGRQNEPYLLALAEKTKDLVGELKLENAETVGLRFDNAKRAITGTPKQEGDFDLRLTGKRKDGENISVILHLFINPDPKTSWKALEPPEDALYRKAHSAYQRIESLEASITAGRVRGRSHAQSAAFCDDDFAINYDDDWGFVGVVCDGAENAKFSREGSRIISSEVANNFLNYIRLLNPKSLKLFLRNWTNDKDDSLALEGQIWTTKWIGLFRDRVFHEILDDSLTALETAILRSPKEEGRNPKDFYTTLLLFWAFPVETGWFLFSYQAGNGAMAVKDGETFTLLNVPDSDEYSGQTKFLSRELFSPKEVSDRCRMNFYSNLQAVWAVSAGLSRAKFPSDASLGLSENWQSLEAEFTPNLNIEGNLLEALNFWSQGENDDRTICVLEVKNKIKANKVEKKAETEEFILTESN